MKICLLKIIKIYKTRFLKRDDGKKDIIFKGKNWYG